MRLRDLRLRVRDVGRRMASAGLVVGTSGNMSARDPTSGLVAIKPSGIPYEDLLAEDIVVLDPAGEVVEGERSPSSEFRMHLAVYAALPDVGGIVHTHSPHATAFAVARKPLRVALAEGAVWLGPLVPVAPYATTGSAELGDTVAAVLREATAALLANHGAVAVGTTVEEALARALVLEDVARIQFYAEALGGAAPLPEDELERIRQAYRRGHDQR